ncbi:hypothetical protein GL218_07139 [Daldinia childiae]|uniref:uncharacterized protein n=1 Tax=Daldinia childiae TaxID=326645 RepID=UPI00144541FE|nr:uncharacterized protein GL218_07139 [Daldinia childiae]KAF3055671.1 hypothetical protein GL218_07139 [Daldinia childiae]
MAWIETQTGSWQRPIGENEAMIKMIGDGGRQLGKDVWSISVTASLTTHVELNQLSKALRDGWKTLRFRHPSIASTSNDETLNYLTPTILDLEEWVDETFVTVEENVTLDDIIASLTPKRFPTLYFMRKDVAVLLHLSHWRTDGIGAFHILNAYLEASAEALQEEPPKLPWGEEVIRLVPSVEEALSLPRTPSLDIERAVKKYLDTLANNIGALGTPYKSGVGLVPKATRSALLPLSADETANLEARCRQLGIELHAALHAAVTATAYTISTSTTNHKHHTSTMRQSLRPHLPAPYDGVAGAAGLYTAGYMAKVPATQSWLENARQYHAEYVKGATADLLCSRRQYALIMRNNLKKASIPDPPPSGLDFSYIPNAFGLVKSVYGDATTSFVVHDIGIGIDVVSRHLYVFAWVFNGRLTLRLVYNEAFYDATFAKGILVLVKEHLVSNLVSVTP